MSEELTPEERSMDVGPSSLTSVLRLLAGRGWTATLIAEDGGLLRCDTCNGTVAAKDLRPVAFRRLEGASDPADMMLVAAVRCPCCGCADVLTLGYGPNADERSADILVDLDLPDDPSWPPPGAEDVPTG